MDENLKYIIEFAKELRKNSSEVTEDESSLEFLINDIEGVRVEEFIDKLVAEGGIFSFKIQNKKIVRHFDAEQKDFFLNFFEDSHGLCDRHKKQFDDLKEEEDNELHIESFKRFKLQKEIKKCKKCSVDEFQYSFTFYKKGILNWFIQKVLKIPSPSGIKIFIWSTVEQLKENYSFDKLYMNSPKPTVFIVCEGDYNEKDGFINIISTNVSNFEEHIKDIFTKLEENKDSLKNIIEKQTHMKIEALKFLPPEFWLDSNTKELEKLNETKKSILNINDGFLLSIFWAISDKIDYDFDTKELKFVLEKDFTAELKLKVEDGRLKHEGKSLDIDSEKELIRWYEKCLYSKYLTFNMKIIKDTIINAGDANFLSVIQQPQKLIRYYEFHYDKLLEEKLKERSDIVKTFINNSQSLKNKLINDTGEVTKNCINIVTILLGLLLSFALIYSRNTNAGKDFAFFVMVLFSLVYIPINTYRIINIVDLANDTIKCFYQDIGVLQKIYRYDFHDIVNAQSENYSAEQKLKTVASVVLTLMGFLNIGLAYLIFELVRKSYEQIIFHNFIANIPFLVLFFIVFSAEIIWLASEFFKKKKIVDEHKEIANSKQ
ncbi:TPA: tRNA modification GTPase [Bacillus cereus]|uniref:tRNA modification GTPase n=1 Tax=unclassified Bacillus cereus group TaxID=2750818 RepID=UPI0029D2EF9C|nr:tRNA modification GTPase [Bacillus cereus]HEI9572960.1 tRNA modification GTPase [Bacillus cereus]HEI9578597.1 tRNA modification GTPase [Bacillus cereus]HEP1847599.1 tRNA modification GTPase [Bacillus cereus]